MKFFIIAGEPSGDRLGAALIKGFNALSPNPAEFIGIGGVQMLDLDFESLFPMEDISIMGVGEILSRYFYLKKRIAHTAQAILKVKPDALITIDLPEFNLRVAEIVRRHSVIPVIHYVAPTVWAWRPNRAKKMARFVNHVLALLPFEPPYMISAGMSCDFVGHPVVEEPVASMADAAAFRERFSLADGPVVLCLPGSRVSEIRKLTPVFKETLKKIREQRPEVRFVLPAAVEVLSQLRALISDWDGDIIVLDPRDPNLSEALAQKRAAFRAADGALAASGTVSLELAASETPMVIGYDMGWVSRQVIGRLVTTDTVTLVNLVSETRDVPEFIGSQCTSENLAKALLDTLDAPDRQMKAMQEAMKRLGKGASLPGERAAKSVLNFIEQNRKSKSGKKVIRQEQTLYCRLL